MNHRSNTTSGWAEARGTSKPRYSPQASLSVADRKAIVAYLTEQPTMWPARLSAEWDIGLEHATRLIAKANEAYKAKSVL